MNPRVSILMTTWNRAGFIGKAIQSVIDQSFAAWELIIIDDGSTDNVADVVKKWQIKEKRIKFIPLSHIGRIAIVSNAGLREALGEYIAILDDDDWWLDPKKLEKQVEFLDKNPDYVGCGGGFIVVDGDGDKKAKILKPQRDESIRKVALFANPIANSSTLFRRSAVEKLGPYDESMLQFADWDFWLKMGTYGKLYNLTEYFFAYRMWEGGMS
ncbi:MAG: glycosyltransferase, partial [bacterium]|nr:glycosyltransferase [bacterium]